jgi:hypothetical protein
MMSHLQFHHFILKWSPDDDVKENVLDLLREFVVGGGTVLQVKCVTCCIFASPHFAFILIIL